MALEKEITKNKVVLLVVSGESFNDSIFKIVKNLSKKHNICYV